MAQFIVQATKKGRSVCFRFVEPYDSCSIYVESAMKIKLNMEWKQAEELNTLIAAKNLNIPSLQ